MLFLSILAFLFLLYTGSRGGILAVVIESFFILLLLSSNYKNLIINSFRLGILAISIILVSYYTLPQVKNKIDQTIYSNNITSGRDKIITTRLPIFMNENKIKLVGVGYGSVAYSQYLLDNNAEKKIGRYSEEKKIYVYHNDDPFFLNITYNIGFIGLALFLIAFFINMKDLFKDIRIEKNILNVGIFVSSIGYFLVYCLFEFIFIDIFILYNILTAILIKKVLSR
nr:O-antigen ligase family protein [Providencia rettgeri]